MKENYWRQNELENEEFQRQKEDQEHQLKLKEEKQREQQQHTFVVNVNEVDTTAADDRQKRRKIWQRLAKKKQTSVQGKLNEKNNNINNNNNSINNDIENEINKNQDSNRERNLSNASNITTTTTTNHLGQNNNNNIDDDGDDDNHEERNENKASLSANDDIPLDDDNITKKREEEILQTLSEQQERLFSAKAAAAATITTTTAQIIVEEKQQVKRQLQQQQRQQQQPNKSNENEINLSFCGCGFLGIYHVGVASCFSEYAPQLSMHKISGSSAGALVAVSHICGNLQLAYATTDILRVAIDARARALGPFHPSFDINAIVREALEKGLPDDVHIKANGKLHVSLTRVYDGENVIISEFGSKEDVIQVLLCSCFIPFWSGLVAPKYKGVTYIDGGFSNNLLTLDDRTVTVSPFSGEADICPQDDTFNLLQVSLSNTSFSLTPNNLYRLSHALLPPPPEILSDLCEQGFADGIRFLQRMKLISCTKCLEIRSSLLVTTNGEDMEEAFTNELEDAAIDGATYGDGLSATSDLRDDVSGWKRFSSNCGGISQTDGKSSMASVGAASLGSSCEMSAATAYLGHQQQSHHPHIILEQQEQKTIEINTATGRRRDSIRSTTSQVYIQQQHHTDSSLPSSSSSSSSSGTRPRFPSSWQLNVNNNNNNDDNNNNNNNNRNAIMLDDNTSLASCNECVQMRQRALNQAMPKQFSDRIRHACDTVNKSLSNWIYSHRPIKYLSYLAAPYFLPLDISLALVYKCWRKLPFIRSEFINCIQEVVSFLIGIMKRMLARTTSTLLVESSLNWESRAIEYEKELINRTPSHSVANSTVNGGVATTTQASMQALAASNVDNPISITDNSKDNSSHSPLLTTATSTNRANSCCSTTTSTTSTNESHFSLRITSDGLCLSKQSRNSASTSQLHSLEDTFDSIVEVSSNQDARIFAYYFRDAKNRLQVTEIFDYERAATNNTDNSANGTTTNTNTIDQPTANNGNNIKQLQQSQQQQPPIIGASPTNLNNNNTTNHTINNNNNKHKV